MSEIDSMMRISIFDAANNCVRENAVATLTLRSGVQLSGQLERPSAAGGTTAHIKTDSGGWVTVLLEEIAAVGTERRR